MGFPKPSNEIDLIEKYFAPLASSSDSSLDLLDDAALIKVPKKHELVVTKDVLVEEIHFLANDPPKSLAWKALAVNLSDLASMGAKPAYYTLGFAIPNHIKPDWIELFVKGLNEIQNKFEILLIGGDTIVTNGPITISVTAFGQIPESMAMKRSGASAGETIYMSGCIGGGYLGLRHLQENLFGLNNKFSDFCVERYQRPFPRVALGMALRDFATSATDISDGLVADLANICRTSSVSATIYADDVPLPKGVKQLIQNGCVNLNDLFSGGDDYELLFTAPASYESRIKSLESKLDVKISSIGKIGSGPANLTFFGKGGKILDFDSMGYSHF
ncbi:MAG: thiamine-phosphate kinase [Alphaproteobacteria bacterium]|nr:thiamine-phosphate kinase [Alphaproteobacteria bacterium]|tara:strand:+ start:168 stop:1160 length:993 start_codon:yes stop_codon:yes gene_type:complete